MGPNTCMKTKHICTPLLFSMNKLKLNGYGVILAIQYYNPHTANSVIIQPFWWHEHLRVFNVGIFPSLFSIYVIFYYLVLQKRIFFWVSLLAINRSFSCDFWLVRRFRLAWKFFRQTLRNVSFVHNICLYIQTLQCSGPGTVLWTQFALKVVWGKLVVVSPDNSFPAD